MDSDGWLWVLVGAVLCVMAFLAMAQGVAGA